MGAAFAAGRKIAVVLEEQGKGKVSASQCQLATLSCMFPEIFVWRVLARVLLSRLWQVTDLYDYQAQPFLLGYHNEDKIKKGGLKKTDFDFKHIIGVSMFGHVVMAKHKVRLNGFIAISRYVSRSLLSNNFQRLRTDYSR